MARSRMRPAALACLLCGCGANVVVADDGGGGGSSSSSTAGPPQRGSGAGAGAGASGGGGGNIDPSGAIQQACLDYCASGCIFETPSCGEDCANGWSEILPECGQLVLDYYQCLMPPSLNDCPDWEDCHDVFFTIDECQNTFLCGMQGDNVCTDDGKGGCDCTSGCDDGHTGRADCVPDASGDSEACDCWFDGVFVGHCEDPVSSECLLANSCCVPLLR